MGVHVDQLDTATRKRLGLGGSKGRTRAKPSRAETGPPTPGTCQSCGERLPGIRAFEKHTKTTGCSRFELDLEATDAG